MSLYSTRIESSLDFENIEINRVWPQDSTMVFSNEKQGDLGEFILVGNYIQNSECVVMIKNNPWEGKQTHEYLFI